MKRYIRSRFVMVLFYVLLTLAVVYMLLLIKPVIGFLWSFVKAVAAPFFIAMIISYVLHPIVNLIHARKVPRTAAVLIIYVVFIAAITVIMMNLIPMFLKQLRELNEFMPQFTMKAQSLMDGMTNHRSLPDSVREGIHHAFHRIEDSITRFFSNVLGGIGTTLDVIFAAFIIPFLVFYMLKDFQMIEKAALAIVPYSHRRETVRMLKDIDEALGNYVRGQFTVCMIIGILAYLGYWLIGMPYPLLLASIVAIFNIIPYLGPFFGAAPAIIMASTISLRMMLYVAAINLIVQVLEGNVISPQVVGRKLQMHPLQIIFVLLVGGELAGVVGLILAVPTYAVLKVIVHHLRLYRSKRQAQASGET